MNGSNNAYMELVENARSSNTNEFQQLNKYIYLDHAASGIYMNSLIEDYHKALVSNQFGNPHSQSEIGSYTESCVKQTRQKILNMFKTTTNEYDCVFVYNATAGLKLLAESFEFGYGTTESSGHPINPVFAYLADNHTSVIGMREVIWKNNTNNADIFCIDSNYKAKHVKSPYSYTSQIEMRTESDQSARNLFCYPAQSNFNGAIYPFDLVDTVGNSNEFLPKYPWFVCLDTASYVCTSPLDLSAAVQPDFFVISFYKIFGFPTGLGALLIKKSVQTKAALKRKTYFGGGTIAMALIDDNKFEFQDQDFHDYFEDGTQSYLDILAVGLAIDKLTTFAKSIDFMHVIHAHTQYLTRICLFGLKDLKHYNNKSLVEIYQAERDHQYGPIIAFNLKNSNGKYISYNLVNKLAQENRIQLRVGCFCNIGACQMFIKDLNIMDNYRSHGHKCGDHIDLIDNKPTGAIRVSFGYCTIRSDIDKLIEFLGSYFIDHKRPQPIMGTLCQPNDKQNVNQYFKVKKVLIYPIKSCGYFEVKRAWPLDPRGSGFLYDRNWILLDHNSVPLTQKRLPKMSNLKTCIDLDRKTIELTIDCNTIEIDLDDDHGPNKTDNLVCFHLNRTKHGHDCGDIVANWLGNAFGIKCRLVRLSTSDDHNGDFKNQCEHLMVSENSIRSLRKFLLAENPKHNIADHHLKALDLNLALQFRPNFLIEILDDEDDDRVWFYEENWKFVRILNSQIKFKVAKLCMRCQMINISQDDRQFSGIFERLLKNLNELKTNSKFGIYLQEEKNDNRNSNHQALVSIGDIGVGTLSNNSASFHTS
jgi:molybdenum cofactor sulfurtransferase